jgi:hypothetical protein
MSKSTGGIRHADAEIKLLEERRIHAKKQALNAFLSNCMYGYWSERAKRYELQIEQQKAKR